MVTFLQGRQVNTGLVGEIEPKLHLAQWNHMSNIATHVMLRLNIYD